jgi:photosystem II stability/assembly factor-like uncharacterized protein
LAAAGQWTPVGPSLGGCVVTTSIMRRSGDLTAICQDEAHSSIGVLVSADGRDWVMNAPTGIDPLHPGDALLLKGLAEDAAGDLLLVGAEASEDISTGDAAAWTSSDAIHWHRVDPNATFTDAEMTGAVATTAGYLAVGADGFPGGNTQLPTLRGAAIWSSPDGQTWNRLPGPPESGKRLLEGIVTSGSRLVIWGDAAGPNGGATWTSTTGDAWSTPTLVPNGGVWGPISRVVAVPGGFIAVGGWSPAANPGLVNLLSAWTSTDGRTWINRTNVVTDAPSALWQVAIVGMHLIGVGVDGQLASSMDGGKTWAWGQGPGLPPADSIRHLQEIDGQLVAFGAIATPSGDEGAIWVTPAESAVVPTDAPVPATTLVDPRVVVTPATNLRDGQTVSVSVTGFGVGGIVRLSECSSAAIATDLGCGDQLAAQTMLATDEHRSGSASFVVHLEAADRALGTPDVRCNDQCVLVATLGAGFGFATAPLGFR